jgi:hypothetical protein
MKEKPIRFRRKWNINPSERIKISKKIYDRQLTRKEIKDAKLKGDFE